MSKQQNKSGGIQPSIGIASANISAAVRFGKASTIGYETNHCMKCLNTEVDIPYSPLTLISSRSEISVIIPYTLYTLLKTCEYQLDEIPSLIQGLREKLDSIYEKWSETGNNPCKRGRVGYKLNIELKQKLNIVCWVIVDLIKNKIVHRLTYAGVKVSCP